jgi:hypothetical protein
MSYPDGYSWIIVTQMLSTIPPAPTASQAALAAMTTALPGTLRGTIRVPTHQRDIPLDCLLLSSRVDAVLSREGYRVVGDLDGLTFGLLARHPGLGRRGLAELRAQLLELGALDPPARATASGGDRDGLDQAEARALARRRRESRVRVPAASRDVLFESFLSLSTRLTNALLASGWRRLGDLHGLRISDIADRYGFGVLTLAELYDFLASQGAIEEPAPPSAHALNAIIADSAMRRYPTRW